MALLLCYGGFLVFVAASVMLGGDITVYLFILSIFLPSLSVHEYAHALVAYIFGDDTAARMGRMTLNPIAHIDLIGTIILPLIAHFGWAKPVPVNFSALNKRQIFMVAAAGPASNLLLVLALTISFHVFRLGTIPSIAGFISLAVLYNLILAVFNLLPIPPLDGSKMVYASLKSPDAIAAYRYFARFGIFILIGFLIGFLRFDGFRRIVLRIVLPVVERLYALLGLPLPF
ncbi:MAG: site-2 protease family protein [Phycisphaerales bacterium]|nr:MAG: site-2 protease family protein [Phycisphaerales bacterium]